METTSIATGLTAMLCQEVMHHYSEMQKWLLELKIVYVYVHAVSSMLSLYSNLSYEQVCGVKGPSVLALHPTFNLVWGIVIDDLHGIFLGVTLTLLHLWLDKTNKTKPFFIGNKVHIHIHVFVISVHLVKLCDYLNVSASVCDKLFR